MGAVKGFLKYDRKDLNKETIDKRIKHFKEFTGGIDEKDLKAQGARCMDCGIPFCQSGCPVDNIIPDWNDLVYRGKWQEALDRLKRTNNFPEFTGRVCPAPCENSCVLAINKPAVTIKNIEVSIIEKGYENNWLAPNPPPVRTGKRVAVVGSGPAGLACADQLNQMGHEVKVYEKNDVPGGLLVLGIPDFKLEKSIVERRLEIMEDEGIEFITNTAVGKDIKLSQLKDAFDALVLCGGAEQSRDLTMNGRDLKGIHFAMDFLTQQNRIIAGKKIPAKERISAKNKNVVVIGGGDTGSDCIGTSIRQGAKSVVNLELLPKPPDQRDINNPWPEWAVIERTSSSHEEGCERIYSVSTNSFEGNGRIEKLKLAKLDWDPADPSTGKREMKIIPESDFEIKADLVLLAMGFTGPVKNGMLTELEFEFDDRGNVKTGTDYMTNIDGIFSAGDMRRGQSLVVWAIKEGRMAAEHIDNYLNTSKEE
jgi:glutamate synthase (NADPH/NADH) small chain